jgi:toluene monooxygenase electron transfer component
MRVISIDGQREIFLCGDDDSLLRAGLRAGLGLPYECSVGACGSCKYELLSGAVEDQWPDAPGLSERDKRKGRRLACQSRPTEDCTIKMRLDPACVPQTIPKRQTIEFQKSTHLTHDMREFHFKSELPAQFLPGQYALLNFPGVSGARAYSMANLANLEGNWKFHIKNMPGGAGSHLLFSGALPEGSNIGLDGPYGLAYLRQSERDMVCIAGGSGLGPMISIARGMSEDKEFAARQLHFFFGGRQPEDICGEDILSQLSAFQGRINYMASISEKPNAASTWTGRVGFVHEMVMESLPAAPSDYEFYFAGPPAMAEAVQRMLMIDNKVPYDQIYFDRFF